MNRLHAVSLVELLLAMSACTAILTLSAALIHRVLFVHSQARAIDEGERAALRISEHFRRDVHAAQAAETGAASGEAAVALRLRLGTGQSIEYRRSKGALLRVVLEGETVCGREQFDFPGEIELAIRDESPELLTLSITAPPRGVPADDGKQAPSASGGPICLEATARLNRYLPSAEIREETEL
jgi:hypothetical protein